MSLKKRIVLWGGAGAAFLAMDYMQNQAQSAAGQYVAENMPMIQQKAGELGVSMASGLDELAALGATFLLAGVAIEAGFLANKAYHSRLAENVGNATGKIGNLLHRGKN